MKFTGERPVYLQIVDDITLQISSGELPPGGRLAPVRDLAIRLGVNPNTVQRAFAELERRGLVGAQSTIGRFVTDDGSARLALRKSQANEAAAQYAATMKRLGYTAGEAAEAAEAAFCRPPETLSDPSESAPPAGEVPPQAAERENEEDEECPS
jgi:DNA-binding transcriptional regulator YhcF (GntR family)